jgi:hypothetical protein
VKLITRLLLITLFFTICVTPVSAQLGSKGGIHILDPRELDDAHQLLNVPGVDKTAYITITLSLNDLSRVKDWETFFKKAKEKKIIPIVRLVSEFDGKNWTIPTRKNITDQISFLSQFEWPHHEKYLIVYNEPNHKSEFGGIIDPNHYTKILKFTADWAHTEEKNYKILPAGLDLAAPNGSRTMEAFTFMNQMLKSDEKIFDNVDYWNSHSYPNPGFISSPLRTGKNSMRGFQYELNYLKKATNKDFKVFITETGWLNNVFTSHWLDYYYKYAAQHIWSDERVLAVTPFILRGDPGPFSGFAFIDRHSQPTKHYQSYQKVLGN